MEDAVLHRWALLRAWILGDPKFFSSSPGEKVMDDLWAQTKGQRTSEDVINELKRDIGTTLFYLDSVSQRETFIIQETTHEVVNQYLRLLGLHTLWSYILFRHAPSKEAMIPLVNLHGEMVRLWFKCKRWIIRGIGKFIPLFTEIHRIATLTYKTPMAPWADLSSLLEESRLAWVSQWN